MKFTKDTTSGHTITAYDDGAVTIGGVDHTRNVIVSAQRIVTEWNVTDAAAIGEADQIELILADEPELVVLGTGAKQTFPPAAALAQFARRGVGLEVMTTAAACRTYNVLLSESRRVTAALILR